jgi:hypothetical protein
VLLSHLILFGYIFPSERHRVPKTILDWLVNRVQTEPQTDLNRACRGTLLSRQQYLRDIEERGFRDARLDDRVRMNGEDIERWTDAIARDGSPEQ